MHLQGMKRFLIFVFCGGLPLLAALEFPNPSLEEDVANIGCPDGWNVPATTEVTLVRDKVSHGGKAAFFRDGYILLSCDLQHQGLAGQKLQISFDAAGADGAELGVRIGYNREIDGQLRWTDSALTWNRQLSEEYGRIQLNVTLPGNVVRERLFFAVYRSNRKGVVWLDNFAMSSGMARALSETERKALNAIARDLNYLAAKLNQALRRKPAETALLPIRKELELLQTRVQAEEVSLLEQDLPGFQQRSLAAINQVLAPGADLVLWPAEACQRLGPDELMPEAPAQAVSLTVLQNEYVALGAGVANCLNQQQSVLLQVSGYDGFSEDFQIRRQVFMMNWYKKEQELSVDPLTLLPGAGGSPELGLTPGETAKLFLLFKVKPQAQGDFTVTLAAGETRLQFVVRVLPLPLPDKPFFANFQCIYPQLGTAGRHPELAARDLAEHYTTGIEFPFLPRVEFHPDGELASADFAGSEQTRWMLAYRRENIQLGLFWQGGYKKFPLAGSDKFLTFQTEDGELHPAWRKAYANLLQAWLKFAESRGAGSSAWLNWGMDELASHEDFARAPGRKVKTGMEIYALGEKIAPEIPAMVTAGNYTLPEDLSAFLPLMDIVLPAWPMPEKLTRWAPADFQARKEFFDKTLPRLKQERERRGLTIWSYKVDAGKRESELNARVYPMAAVGIGFTGVGSWAYNCASGSTWDDSDGGILDYIFVYDGEEDHPLNRQYNPGGEKIVPSIRWEAFRIGIQDGKILLSLKEKLATGRVSPPIAARIEEMLERTGVFGRELQYSWEDVLAVSAGIREILLAVRAEEKP